MKYGHRMMEFVHLTDTGLRLEFQKAQQQQKSFQASMLDYANRAPLDEEDLDELQQILSEQGRHNKYHDMLISEARLRGIDIHHIPTEEELEVESRTPHLSNREDLAALRGERESRNLGPKPIR